MFSFTRCLEIVVHNVAIDSLSLLLRYRLFLISSSNFTSLSFLKLFKELFLLHLFVNLCVRLRIVWRSLPSGNSLQPRSSSLTSTKIFRRTCAARGATLAVYVKKTFNCTRPVPCNSPRSDSVKIALQKGGVPATPSGTATLLRLSPSHQFCPRTLLTVTYFRHPRLPWLDGRCVQGPGTYSPRHG